MKHHGRARKRERWRIKFKTINNDENMVKYPKKNMVKNHPFSDGYHPRKDGKIMGKVTEIENVYMSLTTLREQEM